MTYFSALFFATDFGLLQDFPMESLTSPSSEDAYFSSPLSMKKLEESNGMKDKAEHASPVSVLDQFFVEDIPSPLSTISQSGRLSSQQSRVICFCSSKMLLTLPT